MFTDLLRISVPRNSNTLCTQNQFKICYNHLPCSHTAS